MPAAPIGPQFFGDVELPWPTGEFAGPDAFWRDVGPLEREAKWSLTGMSSDFRFFSVAALVAAGLPGNPVALYWAEQGLPANQTPYRIVCSRTILHGLVTPADRTIYACPASYAAGLSTFLARLSLRDTATGVRWQSVHQLLPLVDWAMVASLTHPPADPPVVPIELFGLEGPQGGFLWWKPANLWTHPLRLTWLPTPPPPPRRPFSSRKGRRTTSS